MYHWCISEKSLTPVEQKTVLFYEDEMTAVIVDTTDGRKVYIPLRPICGRLGLDRPAQLQRLCRDPILSEEMSGVVVTPTPLSMFANPQEMTCLPLEMLNGWLFDINAVGCGGRIPISPDYYEFGQKSDSYRSATWAARP